MSMDDRQAAFLRANASMDGARAELMADILAGGPEGVHATVEWLRMASENPSAFLRDIADNIDSGVVGAIDAAKLLLKCTQIMHATAIEDAARAEVGLETGGVS